MTANRRRTGGSMKSQTDSRVAPESNDRDEPSALAPTDGTQPWCIQVSVPAGEEGSGGRAVEVPTGEQRRGHNCSTVVRVHLRNTRPSSGLFTGTSPPRNLSYLSDIQGDLNITMVTGSWGLKQELLCCQLGGHLDLFVSPTIYSFLVYSCSLDDRFLTLLIP